VEDLASTENEHVSLRQKALSWLSAIGGEERRLTAEQVVDGLVHHVHTPDVHHFEHLVAQQVDGLKAAVSHWGYNK